MHTTGECKLTLGPQTKKYCPLCTGPCPSVAS